MSFFGGLMIEILSSVLVAKSSKLIVKSSHASWKSSRIGTFSSSKISFHDHMHISPLNVEEYSLSCYEKLMAVRPCETVKPS